MHLIFFSPSMVEWTYFTRSNNHHKSTHVSFTIASYRLSIHSSQKSDDKKNLHISSHSNGRTRNIRVKSSLTPASRWYPHYNIHLESVISASGQQWRRPWAQQQKQQERSRVVRSPVFGLTLRHSVRQKSNYWIISNIFTRGNPQILIVFYAVIASVREIRG